MSTPPEGPPGKPADGEPPRDESPYAPPPPGEPAYGLGGNAPVGDMPPYPPPSYPTTPAGQAGYGAAGYGAPGYGAAGYGPPGYGPPAYPPAPEGQVPGAPASNRPIRQLVAGLIVLAVLAAGAVAFVTVGSRGGSATEVVDKFLSALKDKDVDAARNLLCRDGKRKVSADDLRSEFELDGRTITSYQITGTRDTERDGNAETLVTVKINYDQGGLLTLDVGVWNERGKKICSLNPVAGAGG
jgi:hypothetical protein